MRTTNSELLDGAIRCALELFAWGIIGLLLRRLSGKLSAHGGIKMLEGKELEGKIGNLGAYSVDVSQEGFVEVSVGVKVDILAELEKLAAKSGTKIDDSIVEFLKKLLGRA